MNAKITPILISNFISWLGIVVFASVACSILFFGLVIHLVYLGIKIPTLARSLEDIWLIVPMIIPLQPKFLRLILLIGLPMGILVASIKTSFSFLDAGCSLKQLVMDITRAGVISHLLNRRQRKPRF